MDSEMFGQKKDAPEATGRYSAMQIPLRISIAILLAADGKLVAREADFKLFGGESRDREDQSEGAA